MPQSEWARYLDSGDGVELLEAEFDRHVYERHIHASLAIGVTLRGVQRFWCRGATHDSTPGHVIAIAPGESHDGESGSAGGYRYRMFYIPLSIVRDIASEALERPSDERYPSAALLRDPALAGQLNDAWKAMASSRPGLAAEELFHRSVSAVAVHADVQPRRLGVDMPVLRTVRDYLHDHLESAVTMRELASLASMSRFQLTRQFQRAFGLPLHAYHLHVRLEEAKRRLRRGESIARVSADLGFADQSHFHRRFKRWFGITPRSFARTAIQDARPRAAYIDRHE